jgi:hypothetical protein
MQIYFNLLLICIYLQNYNIFFNFIYIIVKNLYIVFKANRTSFFLSKLVQRCHCCSFMFKKQEQNKFLFLFCKKTRIGTELEQELVIK